MNYLLLSMLVPLAALSLSDFRSRKVSVVWLVVLAIVAVGGSLVLNSAQEVLRRCIVNVTILLFLFLCTTFWAWVKERKITNPTDRYIGLGDLLFFPCLVPVFPYRQFSLLLLACMSFSLLWWLVARKNMNTKDIPLIATSSVVVCLAVVLKVFGR